MTEEEEKVLKIYSTEGLRRHELLRTTKTADLDPRATKPPTDDNPMVVKPEPTDAIQRAEPISEGRKHSPSRIDKRIVDGHTVWVVVHDGQEIQFGFEHIAVACMRALHPTWTAEEHGQSEESKRKRGRPKGSKNKSKSAHVQHADEAVVVQPQRNKRGRRRPKPAPLLDYRSQTETTQPQTEITQVDGALLHSDCKARHERRGMYEIVWTGDDEHGYVGNINGIPFYKVKTLLCASPPRTKNPKRKYLYFPERLGTGGYGWGDVATLYPQSAVEAKTYCETDYACNGGITAWRELLDDALAIIKAAGYRIAKPKKPKTLKRKNCVGPTYQATFSDGVTTRMSVFTSLENLDWGRGERLAQAAYQSRWRTRMLAQYREQNGGLRSTRWQYREIDLVAPVPPAIISAHFEQDGRVLAQRSNESAS